MSRYAPSKAFVLGRRGMALLATMASAAALCFSMAAGPVSKASAETFCSYIWAAPYGQPGDRCTASTWIWPEMVMVQAYEHSGCADAVGVYNNLVQSWLCTPGNNQFITMWFAPEYIPMKGIIRNNSTGAGTHLAGHQVSY